MTKPTAAKRPFSHPLFGSSFPNLCKVLIKNHPIHVNRWAQVSTALLAAFVRLPLTGFEKVLAARSIRRMPKMKAPVFIIGHWRSGTTHLSNILCKSPQFGFVTPLATGLPWELLTLGKYFRPLLERSIPANRLIDNVPVKADSPQEDEFALANMLSLSFCHGLYFPKNFEKNVFQGLFFEGCEKREIENWKRTFLYYLKKITIHQENEQLLLRNPVYTARIPLLKQLIPEAKFIHIYRNPFRVFPSMKNYYRKLFPALALQDYSHVDIEQMVLKIYSRLMGNYSEAASALPPQDLVEVRFENLEANPLEEVERIYRQLKLTGIDAAKPHFENYLESIKTYRKNVFHHNPRDVALVSEHWGKYVERWGYSPEVSGVTP